MIGRIINKIQRAAQLKRGIVSHSQCGEDLIINYVFTLRGLLKPSFIDIGANHPFGLSNTAFFYKKGSRGINIEPNPDFVGSFKKYRPEDINLNLGIGSSESVLEFYVFEDNTLSTFSESEHSNFVKAGKKLKKKIQVQVRTINYVINQYCNDVFPDLLCIDVEGWDFEIIKSIDFSRTAPKVICVEAAEYSPIGAGQRRDELINYIKEQGYYEYANTNLNAIMVRNDFWFDV
jgi:FkbM family methyltransferase